MFRKTGMKLTVLAGFALLMLGVNVARADEVTMPAQSVTAARAAGYPNAIVIVGDGGAVGRASDPVHPFRDAPENSWATGTNPAVQSIYSRILAVNPAIQGHNVNLAQDGPTVAQFMAQVHKAIALNPKPDLVIVQIGDREVASCDGQDATHYAAFGAGLSGVLKTLSNGLPNARILLVSPWGGSYGSSWGSFDSYARYLGGLDLGLRLGHAGHGICQFVDSPSGRVVPERVAYMKKTWAGYEAQKAAACAQFPRCRYDDGVAGRITVTADDIAKGGGYPSIQGNARLAAAEWAAMSDFFDRFSAG
jgi:hypothetical protein